MKLLLPFLLYATAASLFGQPSDVLLSHNFDNGAEGWIAMGSTATTAFTTKAGAAKRGKGALEFTYDLSKPFAAAILPVTVSLEPMKRIRFWGEVRSRHIRRSSISRTQTGWRLHRLVLGSRRPMATHRIHPFRLRRR